jgi:hypothetical protein
MSETFGVLAPLWGHVHPSKYSSIGTHQHELSSNVCQSLLEIISFVAFLQSYRKGMNAYNSYRNGMDAFHSCRNGMEEFHSCGNGMTISFLQEWIDYFSRLEAAANEKNSSEHGTCFLINLKPIETNIYAE